MEGSEGIDDNGTFPLLLKAVTGRDAVGAISGTEVIDDLVQVQCHV
jgi:hypothetical protein